MFSPQQFENLNKMQNYNPFSPHINYHRKISNSQQQKKRYSENPYSEDTKFRVNNSLSDSSSFRSSTQQPTLITQTMINFSARNRHQIKSREFEPQLPIYNKVIRSKTSQTQTPQCRAQTAKLPESNQHRQEVFDQIKRTQKSQQDTYFHNLQRKFQKSTQRFQEQRSRKQSNDLFNFKLKSQSNDPVLGLLEKWDEADKQQLSEEGILSIFKILHSTPLKKMRTKRNVFNTNSFIQTTKQKQIYPQFKGIQNSVFLPQNIKNLVRKTLDRRSYQRQQAENCKFFM